MGRAGVPLLSKAMGVKADIITLGGLYGFPIPVLMSQEIADGIAQEHGSTLEELHYLCSHTHTLRLFNQRI